MKALTLVATAATIMLANTAWAQQGVSTDPNVRPVIRSLVDHTRTQRLIGPPANPPSGGTSGAAGATLLPFNMPPGSYYNDANYPLNIRTIRSGFAYHEIAVEGRVVAGQQINDSGSDASISAIIPAKSNFSVNQSSVVTALANSATWQQTSVRFAVGEPVWSSAYQAPAAPVFKTLARCPTVGAGDAGGTYEIGVFAVEGGCIQGNIAYGRFDGFNNLILTPSFVYNYAFQSQDGAFRVNIVESRPFCVGGTRSLDNYGVYGSSFITTFQHPATSSASCTPAAIEAAFVYSTSCTNPANAGLPGCVPPDDGGGR